MTRCARTHVSSKRIWGRTLADAYRVAEPSGRAGRGSDGDPTVGAGPGTEVVRSAAARGARGVGQAQITKRRTRSGIRGALHRALAHGLRVRASSNEGGAACLS